jgi:hypothetical protein
VTVPCNVRVTLREAAARGVASLHSLERWARAGLLGVPGWEYRRNAVGPRGRWVRVYYLATVQAVARRRIAA